MRHLFFDGAFGTYYISLTGDTGMCERANTDNPAAVLRIHREYIEAGARAIKTNTFCANPLFFGEDTERIIRQGYSLACEAAEGRAEVFADIGCISDPEAAGLYLRTVEIFLSLGAVNFLFETLDDFDPIVPAIKAIRSVPGSTVAVSFAATQDGYTKKGKYYKDLLSQASTAADIVGLNCLCGPSRMTELVSELDLSGIRFLGMPNAGYPSAVNGRLVYHDNPEYFASKLSELASLGVYALGGCCGTTPDHIRRAVAAVGASSPAGAFEKGGGADEAPVKKTSRIASALESGKRPVFVELDPPVKPDAAAFSAAAAAYFAGGADVLTVPDSPLARTRADSFLMAARLHRETGLPVLPHLTCRDKNGISIQSSLLAASIEGISDVLLITGDPLPPTYNRGESVFAFNSETLLKYISDQNQTAFSSAPFCLSAALNTNARNFGAELDRAKRKREAGASYFLTQAIFSDESIERVAMASQTLKTPVIAGIMPVGSYKNALFLNNEVHGFSLPDDLMKLLSESGDFDAAILTFCRSVIDRVSPACAGYYIMPQLRRSDLSLALLKYIKESSK